MQLSNECLVDELAHYQHMKRSRWKQDTLVQFPSFTSKKTELRGFTLIFQGQSLETYWQIWAQTKSSLLNHFTFLTASSPSLLFDTWDMKKAKGWLTETVEDALSLTIHDIVN